MRDSTTVYRGIRVQATGDSLVYVNDQPLSAHPSQRVCNHSPDGFNWGYAGSGPAQLALAILLDYYGHGRTEVRFYQQFKFEVVARFPQEGDWMLTGRDIEAQMTAILALAAGSPQ